MAVLYTVTHSVNNSYTFTNTGSTPIYIALYKQPSCGIDEWDLVTAEQLLAVSGTITIATPNEDGLYRFQLSDHIVTTTYLPVYNYRKLFASMLEDIDYVLCGCACEGCPECGKQEKDYLSALIKLMTYNVLNDGMYNEFLLSTNNCVRCLIADANECMLRRETILGEKGNTLLMKQLISYYYLVYMYVDSEIIGNLASVKTYYNYNEIIKCIRQFGIDEDCIKSTISAEFDT